MSYDTTWYKARQKHKRYANVSAQNQKDQEHQKPTSLAI